VILVIADNEAGIKPLDSKRLKLELSRITKPVNVRVASNHVEVSLAREEDLGKVVDFLEYTIGKVLAIRRPRDMEAMGRDTLKVYEDLVVEERFWEAHDVLESTWRSSAENSERRKLKTLIKIAAAMAKAQEGFLEAALSIAGSLDNPVRGCLEATVAEAWSGSYAGLLALKCAKLAAGAPSPHSPDG